MGPTGRLDCMCLVVCGLLLLEFAEAQDGVVYSSGSMAGAIIGTFLVTLTLVALGYLFYRYYLKNRREKNLVLVTNDPENVKDEFAFDNPGFKTENAGGGGGGGWLRSQAPPPLGAGGKHPPTALGPNPTLNPTRPGNFKDDTYIENVRSRTVIPLWSRDFTGLGFDVSGGMRDGIHVSSVLRGGPAAESGKIHPGDRINSVTISFRHMVYEDAVSILSYASPYELRLEVEEGDGLNSTIGGGGSPLVHPKLRRAASHADVNELEKATRNHHSPKSRTQSPNSTLETSHKNTSASSAIKKIISDKIQHTSNTLERMKHPQGNKDRRDVHHMTTLEREHEKNAKNKHHIESSPIFEKMKVDKETDHMPKPERNKNRNSTEVTIGNAQRVSSPPDVVIIKDGGDKYSAKVEKTEVQKRESDAGKKGMKFGIRVLPPNVPDDGTVINNRNSKHDGVKSGTENGSIVAEIRNIDEVDKNFANNVSVKEIETHDPQKTKQTAPVVAKRREKPIAPVPNARNLPQNNVTVAPAHIEIKMEPVEPQNTSAEYENIVFVRSDELNSSGIKRDAQGIPQEIPQHMMEAAMFARNNRKSSAETNTVEKSKPEVPAKKELPKIDIKNEKESASIKNNKKSKGKAPSPPEGTVSRSDQDYSDNDTSNTTQDTVVSVNKSMNFTDNFEDMSVMQHFIEGERNHSSVLPSNNKSDDMILSKINTSTPKAEKSVKRMRPDIPTPKPTLQIETQDDVDSFSISSFQKKEASDSLNNYFNDSKSNFSSNQDFQSVTSLSQDSFVSNANSELDKLTNTSTTIELNSSDITIHSSPTNENEHQIQESDDNERKAASLGDLSRLEPVDKSNRKPSQGTLERAQSLDITTEEAKIVVNEKHIVPKKRKSNSVFDGSYYDNDDEPQLDSNENVNQMLTHSKEPRLSLNINNISMEGLNTFQRNRLKKASEWGNLEDAIFVKKDLADSSHSGSSEITNSVENLNQSDSSSNNNVVAKALQEETFKLNEEIDKLTQMSNESVGQAIETAVQKSNEINKDVNDKMHAFNIQQPEFETVVIPKDSIKHADIAGPKTFSMESHKIIAPKPEVQIRTKPLHFDSYDTRPNFEIGTYVSDPSSSSKYKTDSEPESSSRLSPKLEDKLTMIYDTNIPDDIKVSRHTLVSSLERPKSDLMKKLLAQNPTLSGGIEISTEQNVSKTDLEKNEQVDMVGTSAELTDGDPAPDVCDDKNADHKTNATSFTLLNQPDIVNLRIKQTETEIQNAVENVKPNQESEFVSSINIVGATSKNEPSKINFNFNSQYPSPTTGDKIQPISFFSTTDNVVTITTDGSQPSSIITIEGDPSGMQNVIENYKNSIEIKDFDDSKDDTIKMNQSEVEQSLYNEIISELQKAKDDEVSHEQPIVSASSKTYLIEGNKERSVVGRVPYVIDTKTLDVPGQKTVTVNVTEDELGNRIITQNIEETVTRLVTVTSTPLEVEEYTFGIIKNPTEEDMLRLQEMEGELMDPKMLADIQKQNPNLKLLSSDPAYTNTQTMTVNANMTEDEARMLLQRFKDNPQIMMGNNDANHAPGIVIKETAVVVEESGKSSDPHQMVTMSQASYKFKNDSDSKSPPIKIMKMIENDGKVTLEGSEVLTERLDPDEIHRLVEKMNKSNGEPTKVSESIFKKTDVLHRNSNFTPETNVVSRMEISSNTPTKDYITEIEVLTPKTESSNQMKSKDHTKYYLQPNTFNQINLSFMGDFLNNERQFSDMEKHDSDKFERRKSFSPESSTTHNGSDDSPMKMRQHNDDNKPKRHSDFDLPRNTHIKFRTATYEPQTAAPNRLTSSEKRLSQIEILKSNFEKGSSESLTSPKPLPSAKPSNIPVKLPDKGTSTQHKASTVSPSKIPVLHSSSPKVVSSNSQDADKATPPHKTSPHGKLSTSTGNISVTSIKSSSRNPSGK